MKWLKKNWTNLVLGLILICGLGLILYPSVSDYWNKMHQSRAISQYSEAVAQLDNEEYDRILQSAYDFNESLMNSGSLGSYSAEQAASYPSQLLIGGSDVMGYIEIEKIKCYLPIYHGTDDSVLQVAVGHIEGSSLPVGGESTHAVLSGHRGLPSAKLFTDLDKLEIGDPFVIRVLDETLTYEVDQVLIVEPGDTSSLGIVEGMDYVTLITCTPYGVNTHRMLVRGHRIDNLKSSSHAKVTSEAIQIKPAIVAPIIAIPILLLLIVLVLIQPKER